MTFRGALCGQWGWPMFLIYTVVGKNSRTTLRGLGFAALAGILTFPLKRVSGMPAWVCSFTAYLALCLLAWSSLLGRLLLFRPFPICRKGKCRGIDDYSWSHGLYFGKCAWGMYFYWCKCGDRYLRRGERFMEWTPGEAPEESRRDIRKGQTLPYKRLVGFRKWQDDLMV